MAAQGTPFETPRACPFVALELDRDRRSDKPDYRHRCFAEPTPAPRSIAHQEAYCLSPNFAGCPVFQDWAVRAAARPADGTGASASAAASGPQAAADDEGAPAPEPVFADLPEDASVTPAGAEIAAAAAAVTGMTPGIASPPTFATTDWQSEADESQQLAAFDAPAADADADADAGHFGSAEPTAPAAPAATPSAPEPMPAPPAVPPPVPPPTPPASSASPSYTADDAAAAAAPSVPAFLAGRTPRPMGSTIPSPAAQPRPSGPVNRDEIVPSWEIDGRYGAEAPDEPGGNRLDSVLTAIAVLAILAIGVAAVLFLPGLLSHNAPSHTPGPSILLPSTQSTALPSGLPTVAPSGVPTIGPSVAPTAAPSVGPVGSPRLYKIKSGDSLAKIANKYHVTIQQILDANPSITDPNHIEVGVFIVIPLPAPSSP
jgi:hypothetical protein